MSIKFEMTVESYDVQPNGNIKISSLLKMLQKAAGDDVNKTNLNYNNLASHNIAFVLTKMSLKILKDIKLYDVVTIISHPRHVRGATFPRDFIISVNGDVCAVATSNWVLIDLVKRTILRPSSISEYGDLPPSDEDLFELADVKFNFIETSPLKTNVLSVEYSHLDMNNHLNNTYYADFIFNNISPDYHDSDKGLYLQINYKAEALFGDNIEISTNFIDNSYIFSAKNISNDKICFTAYVSKDIE